MRYCCGVAVRLAGLGLRVVLPCQQVVVVVVGVVCRRSVVVVVFVCFVKALKELVVCVLR